jgi:hypothetical protein
MNHYFIISTYHPTLQIYLKSVVTFIELLGHGKI